MWVALMVRLALFPSVLVVYVCAGFVENANDGYPVSAWTGWTAVLVRCSCLFPRDKGVLGQE